LILSLKNMWSKFELKVTIIIIWYFDYIFWLLNLNKLPEAEKYLENGYELIKKYAKNLAWYNVNEYNDAKIRLINYYTLTKDKTKLSKLNYN
jgi:hypothetical protein